MTHVFKTASEWIAHCRALVRDDWDNLILIDGPERSGKSTLMMQLGRALDDTFTVDRVHLSIRKFIAGTWSTPKYGVRVCDELKANKRKAMHGEIIELIEHLQVIGYKNHHMLVCFPHADKELDGAIMDNRVRWKAKIIRRGWWELYGRQTRTDWTKRGPVEHTIWVKVGGPWPVHKNTGPIWEQYLAKKDAEVQAMSPALEEPAGSPTSDIDKAAALARFKAVQEYEEPPVEPEDEPGSGRVVLSSGVNVSHAATHFLGLRRKYEESAGARAAINQSP